MHTVERKRTLSFQQHNKTGIRNTSFDYNLFIVFKYFAVESYPKYITVDNFIIKNHHWATSSEGIIFDHIYIFNQAQYGEMNGEFLFYKDQKCICKGFGNLTSHDQAKKMANITMKTKTTPKTFNISHLFEETERK